MFTFFPILTIFGLFSELWGPLVIAGQVRKSPGWSQIILIGSNIPPEHKLGTSYPLSVIRVGKSAVFCHFYLFFSFKEPYCSHIRQYGFHMRLATQNYVLTTSWLIFEIFVLNSFHFYLFSKIVLYFDPFFGIFYYVLKIFFIQNH